MKDSGEQPMPIVISVLGGWIDSVTDELRAFIPILVVRICSLEKL